MKKSLLVLALTLILVGNNAIAQKAYEDSDTTIGGDTLAPAAAAQYEEINQNDLNYISKGYWEIAANGYTSREDLILTEVTTKTIKVGYYDREFLLHRICKNGLFMGYVISVKQNSFDNKMYCIVLLENWFPIVDTQNEETIKTVRRLNADLSHAFLEAIVKFQGDRTIHECGQ